MVKKRVSGHKESNRSGFSTSGSEHLNQVLIDNFVRLQKVLVTNAEKMDLLTMNISKLLQIFEVSARSFAEKNFRPSGAVGSGDLQKEAEFLGKLNTLLDQNKTIAKGLSLLGDDLKEKLYGETPAPGSQNNRSFPQPTIPQITRQRMERIDLGPTRFQVKEEPKV
ncbi:MAG: hypothetical protein AABW73_00550 [Nanoarchaeota archaeon]